MTNVFLQDLQLIRVRPGWYETRWKRNQDAVFYIRLSRARDQGLRFWQTTSFATITYTTVPGDCIDRVISQNGDRVLFQRLATSRPPPKVTLKSHWQIQQQQLNSRMTLRASGNSVRPHRQQAPRFPPRSVALAHPRLASRQDSARAPVAHAAPCPRSAAQGLLRSAPQQSAPDL